MKAHIVVDLGFGDSGKGRTVDYLCSQAENPIVVRFSGGQQAGHTVIRNGVKHVHSNYGSGTLQGIPSYFSEHTTIYLNTMARECEVLQSKGIEPVLYVHPLTKITTPYDVAYNRITEKKLNHGSCGLGVAATMKRNEETGYKLYACDILHMGLFMEKLDKIKNYYLKLVSESNQNIREFEDEYQEYETTFILNTQKKLFNVKDYSFLSNFHDIIFEGSQGVLLDMNHGIFPNVTYANTTSKNALEIIKTLRIKDVVTYYVTRCYQTRHGNGWMSNETPIKLVNTEEEINKYNQWQGNFRIGEIDYDLLNYAINIDRLYNSGIHNCLVVTCLDQRPGFKFQAKKINNIIQIYESNSFENNLTLINLGWKSRNSFVTEDR